MVKTMTKCRSCKASSTILLNRRVSLSSFDRKVNAVMCIDHFFLGTMIIFHIMEASSRFPAGIVIESTCYNSCIFDFELVWFAQF